MGVAPPPEWGRITSIIPRAHGGNLDIKALGAGATLYLPVFNDGALFSAGDGHAVQGDGEVDGNRHRNLFVGNLPTDPAQKCRDLDAPGQKQQHIT